MAFAKHSHGDRRHSDEVVSWRVVVLKKEV